jgi:hypothetical protein
METLKGKVSNIQRDVEVIGPDYSGDSYTSGSTTDITKFVLSGRSMQYKSSRPTYDAISDGDELIVAGNLRQTVFYITMPLLFSLPFLAAGLYLLYLDHNQSAAIKAIEGYK